MDQPPREEPTLGGGLDDMTQAMMRQTTITSQIADRLAAMPTNQDFIQLLETVSNQTDMQQTLITQNHMLMQYLMRVHTEDVDTESKQQPHEEACPTPVLDAPMTPVFVPGEPG